MNKLFDVTFWDGSRLIATAENIVATNGKEAVQNGLRAIGHRRRTMKNAQQLVQLKKHLEFPKIHLLPDGIRVFVAEKERGMKVIG